MDPFIEPGVLVRHPGQPDWGLGQVQSVIGHRVTVWMELEAIRDDHSSTGTDATKDSP